MLQITLFEVALEAFHRDVGCYPPGPNGLSDLVRQPPGATNWHGPYLQGIPQTDYYQLNQSTNWLGLFPYLKNVPKDPWGNDYIYECPGKHRFPNYGYELVSLGPPGKNGRVANWEFKMMLR
jgi:general secretion pathway protein G